MRMGWLVLWGLFAEIILQVAVPPLEACLAETPLQKLAGSLPPQGSDMRQLVINFVGSALAGFAAAAETTHWVEPEVSGGDPDRSESKIGTVWPMSCWSDDADCQARMIHGIKNGFVVVWTSYVAMVEHIGEMLDVGDWRAALYDFLMSFLGGPLVFILALLLGQSMRVRFRSACFPCRCCCVRRRGIAATPIGTCVFVISVGLVFLGLLMEEHYQAQGDSAMDIEISAGHGPQREQTWMVPGAVSLRWQLPWGLLSVSVAMLLASYIEKLTQDWQLLQQTLPGIDWPAVVQNVMALFVGHFIFCFEKEVLSEKALLRLKKTRQAFAGTCSAYARFSEIIGSAVLSRNWRVVWSNLVVNAYFAGMSVILVLVT